jgi:hypothetical protein
MATRYTLDARAAAKLRRQITSTPFMRLRSAPERKSIILCMCKIEAHEGAGVYQAIEVFWNGSAWASDANVSRKFGVAYGTNGLRQIAADTGVATNTIVRAFAFGVASATGLADWFFQEGGGGGAYAGPFAVTAYSTTQAAIGAARTASSWLSDYILIHPDIIVKTSQEIVTVTDNGVLYYEIKREDWDGVAIAATPYFATTLPVSTTMYMMVPLAGVTFAGGVITGFRQIQYGNIIIDKTSADYCP